MRTLKIVLDTTWQRNSIWTKSRKVLLIDSIFKNYHIPEIIFSKENKENKTIWESLDGKQRCTTINEYKNNIFKWEDKFYSDLSIEKRDLFDSTQIACTMYSNIDESTKIDIFNRIQMGANLTSGERVKSRSTSKIRNYIFDLYCDNNNVLNDLRLTLKINRDSQICIRFTWLTCLMALLANYFNCLEEYDSEHLFKSAIKYVSKSFQKLDKFMNNFDEFLTDEIKIGFEEKIGVLIDVIEYINCNDLCSNYFDKAFSLQDILPIFHSICRSKLTLSKIKERWCMIYCIILMDDNININVIHFKNEWNKLKRKNISVNVIVKMYNMFGNFSIPLEEINQLE